LARGRDARPRHARARQLVGLHGHPGHLLVVATPGVRVPPALNASGDECYVG
jgi:hypothetical protein